MKRNPPDPEPNVDVLRQQQLVLLLEDLTCERDRRALYTAVAALPRDAGWHAYREFKADCDNPRVRIEKPGAYFVHIAKRWASSVGVELFVGETQPVPVHATG